MYNTLNAVLDITMVVVTLWIVNRFLGVFFEKRKWNVGQISVQIIFVIFQLVVEINKGEGAVWKTVLNLGLMYAISITNYKKIGKANVFIVLMLYSIWSLMEIVVFYSLNALEIEKLYADIIGVVVSKIIMIVICYVISLCWKKKDNEVFRNKYYLLLLLVPVGSIYIALNEFFVRDENNIPASLITFSILLIINVVVFDCYSRMSDIFKYEKEKAIYLQHIDMISRNTEEQKRIMEEFYVERHNLVNELIVLKESIEKDDKGYVLKNINRIIHIWDSAEKIATSGNNIIDAIINCKYIIAKEQEIKFRLKVFIPQELPFDQCDMGVILGNAIDNAVDAVKGCTICDKYVDISMGVKKESLVIVIKNPYEHNLRKDSLGRLLSSKEESEKHGYGLKSIEEIVQKYHGEVVIDADNNIFQLMVVMNVVDF